MRAGCGRRALHCRRDRAYPARARRTAARSRRHSAAATEARQPASACDISAESTFAKRRGMARAWAWWLVLGAAAGARELDPAACAARFDVQRDKIIRTEESREMGARYLSELDVGARAECLRLCCETDACDVFVYEEKGPGSCYLFQCGPPEDFRCKFTAHGNFSSGVLALSRRLAELQDQEQRALASLRASSSTSTSSTSAAPPAAPRCSRYQFECRRGGECVAVYNACDGVPQCADGSDEAPELGCPPTAAEPAPPRWPHRLAQAQPPRRFDAGAPHIFSHKGGLLQDEQGAYAAFEPPAPWPHRAWPPQPGGEAAPGAWGGAARGWERAWPVPPVGAARRPPEEAPANAPPEAMPEVPLPAAGERPTLRDSAKKGPAPAPPTAPPPTAAPRPSPPAERRPAPPAAERHLALDEHDGLSERPPAAVLLLVLGVALTAALGGTLGCRARAARRRLRRGKPFAHDADYLVNGMYL